MKKRIPFKCSYNDIPCSHLDTSTMTLDISCEKCEHYDNGTRLSRGTPILESIVKFFSNKK